MQNSTSVYLPSPMSIDVAGLLTSSILPAVKSVSESFPAGSVSWAVVAPGAKLELKDITKSCSSALGLALGDSDGLILADGETEGEALGLREALGLTEGD